MDILFVIYHDRTVPCLANILESEYKLLIFVLIFVPHILQHNINSNIDQVDKMKQL